MLPPGSKQITYCNARPPHPSPQGAIIWGVIMSYTVALLMTTDTTLKPLLPQGVIMRGVIRSGVATLIHLYHHQTLFNQIPPDYIPAPGDVENIELSKANLPTAMI